MFNLRKKKLTVGIMGLAAKPIAGDLGGICAPHTVIQNLVTGLEKLGHEVILFTGKDSKFSGQKEDGGLQSTYSEYGPESKDIINYTARRIEYDLILASKALEYFKSSKIDLLNCHDFRTSPYLFAQTNFPVVYTVHGDLGLEVVHQTPYDQYRYRLMASCENLAMISLSSSNEDIVKKLKIRSVGIAPNGIDTQKFEPGNKGRSGVLFAGRIIPLKRVKETIEAALSLNEEITLVGPKGITESDLEYFDNIEKKYFSNPKVHYKGFLPQEKIIPYYQSSKALIYFSETEGMPLGILEAMSCGLPVAASAVGGIIDIIENEKNGILLSKAANLQELTKSIEQAMKIDGQKCRDRISSCFSVEAMAQAYEKAYYKLLFK